MIKLIATDMDGTFLDGQGTFDKERFDRVLTTLEARQIPFVVASGNGMSRLLNIFDGFADRLLFVAENGGHIYQKGQTLYREPLKASLIQEVLDYLGNRVRDHCFMMGNDEHIYMAEGAPRPFDGQLVITKEQLEAFLSRISHVPDLASLLAREPFYKMGMWVPKEQIDGVVADFNQAFSGQLVAVMSGYGGIDILPEGIHKAWGLKRLMTSMGIEAHQLMAFGDGDNDQEMLAMAGYSYAVANATEGTKAVAKFQIPAHDTGSVLSTIEAYLEHDQIGK